MAPAHPACCPRGGAVQETIAGLCQPRVGCAATQPRRERLNESSSPFGHSGRGDRPSRSSTCRPGTGQTVLSRPVEETVAGLHQPGRRIPASRSPGEGVDRRRGSRRRVESINGALRGHTAAFRRAVEKAVAGLDRSRYWRLAILCCGHERVDGRHGAVRWIEPKDGSPGGCVAASGGAVEEAGGVLVTPASGFPPPSAVPGNEWTVVTAPVAGSSR